VELSFKKLHLIVQSVDFYLKKNSEASNLYILACATKYMATKEHELMRVLIVDDDPILIMVCGRLMKITGFSDEVVSAREGREALQVLEDIFNSSPEKLPEVILLDINMPVMNGWEFLEDFKRLVMRFPREIPVYMLSSTIDQADFDKAKTYPVIKGFYSKPLTKDNLEEIKQTING